MKSKPTKQDSERGNPHVEIRREFWADPDTVLDIENGRAWNTRTGEKYFDLKFLPGKPN